MKNLDFDCYGESLESTPDFFSMKGNYEENLFIQELNSSENFSKFDTLKIKENLKIDCIKESTIKEEVYVRKKSS